MSETQNEPVLGAKCVVRLCAALLTGFAFVTAFAVHDKARLAQLEKVDEPTAVGDAAFFKPPEKFDSGAVFVKLGGQPLHPTGTERYALPDATMIRAGIDDSKAFRLYKSTERGGRDGDYFFLKVGNGQYLEMSRERMAE